MAKKTAKKQVNKAPQQEEQNLSQREADELSQDKCSIVAVTNEDLLHVLKDMGLMQQAFQEAIKIEIKSLKMLIQQYAQARR
jgi:hypothetical protein